MTVSWEVRQGDALDRLREMPAGSVQTCVTSPPYFGLRDYGTGEWEGGDEGCDHLAPPGGGTAATGLQRDGRSEEARQGNAERVVADRRQQFREVCGKCGARRVDQQVGLEATPDEYVARLVEVFREVRRVLRDDGTLWLNLGDSYGDGKQLLGVPWRVAFALQADGWILRQDIIWAKKNCMPESVTDRPTKAHEYLFLLSKSPRYFYDADAIREDHARLWDPSQPNGGTGRDGRGEGIMLGRASDPHSGMATVAPNPAARNKRSVWTVATAPFPGAHFAVFPPKLIEPCVLAGAAEGHTVLDPFAGAGTTGLVATRHGRSFIGIELNPEYAEMARDRIRDDAPLMNYLTERAA